MLPTKPSTLSFSHSLVDQRRDLLRVGLLGLGDVLDRAAVDAAVVVDAVEVGLRHLRDLREVDPRLLRGDGAELDRLARWPSGRCPDRTSAPRPWSRSSTRRLHLRRRLRGIARIVASARSDSEGERERRHRRQHTWAGRIEPRTQRTLPRVRRDRTSADRTDNWLLTATNCSGHRNVRRATFSARGLGSRRRRGDRRAKRITSRPAARRSRGEPAAPCGALRGDRARLRAAAHRAARRGARAGPEPPPRARGREHPQRRRAAARHRPGGRDRRRVPPLHVHRLVLRQRRRPAGRRRRRPFFDADGNELRYQGLPIVNSRLRKIDSPAVRETEFLQSITDARFKVTFPCGVVLRAALRLQERRDGEGVRRATRSSSGT